MLRGRDICPQSRSAARRDEYRHRRAIDDRRVDHRSEPWRSPWGLDSWTHESPAATCKQTPSQLVVLLCPRECSCSTNL